MGFAEALAADTVRTGPRCTVGIALQTMTGDDLAALKAALADKDRVTGAAIARALTASGTKIGGSGVRRHRAGDCSCGPS